MAAEQLFLGLAPPVSLSTPSTVVLPPVLAEPPWRRPRPAPAPIAPLDLALLPAPPRMRWSEPERLLWRRRSGPLCDTDADRDLALLEAAAQSQRAAPAQLRHLSGDRALDLWTRLPPTAWVRLLPEDVLEILARFGVDALPGLLVYAAHDLGAALPGLAQVSALAVAPWMAQALCERRRWHATARRWLLAEPLLSAMGLIPDATGADPARQRRARFGLRLLVNHGAALAVRQAARRYGAAAVAHMDAWLDRDPLWDVPPRRPQLPAFWDVDGLPRPRLRSGQPLSRAAFQSLGEMLSFTPADPAYLGLQQVRTACQPESLDDFVLALLERWVSAGAPPGQDWALWAVGHLGGSRSAQQLAARLRGWAPARAARGALALALIDDPSALTALHLLALQGRHASLRQAAGAALADRAADAGLTPGALLDRARPAPVTPAVLRSTGLRLEQAMCTGERWSLAAWRELCAQPAVQVCGVGLIWALHGADGARLRLLHTGEILPPAAVGHVVLPHPLELEGVVLPPLAGTAVFPQRTRRWARPSVQEQASTGLARFAGVEVPAGAVLALLRGGWSWGEVSVGRGFQRCERVLPELPGFVAELELSPGLQTRAPTAQRLGSLRVRRRADGAGGPGVPLGRLPARLFSELERELARLCGLSDSR